MRPVFSALFAIGLLAGQVGTAFADQCARPIEKTAFDVAGLKSQLMVTAISCQLEDKYNVFVTRFRADLVQHEKALNSYFQRANGRRAQQEHDDYITQLANSQSQTAIKSGTLFCMKNTGMFDEVMALKDGKDLPTYAAGKTLTQPIVFTDCPAPAAKVVRTATATKKKAEAKTGT